MDLSLNQPPKIELEDQFILRLPPVDADYLRSLLKLKPGKVKKRLKIDLALASGEASVVVRKKIVPGRLRRLPTITESYKTYDGSTLVKTADICQILDCTGTAASDDLVHGLTPPLKNVKKRRFRKCTVNEDNAAISVDKELFYLLQADLEAVVSKFEIVTDSSGSSTKTAVKSEVELFGNVLTDSEETESNTEEVE